MHRTKLGGLSSAMRNLVHPAYGTNGSIDISRISGIMRTFYRLFLAQDWFPLFRPSWNSTNLVAWITKLIVDYQLLDKHQIRNSNHFRHCWAWKLDFSWGFWICKTKFFKSSKNIIKLQTKTFVNIWKISGQNNSTSNPSCTPWKCFRWGQSWAPFCWRTPLSNKPT